MPQSPITTLGTAASISISVPTVPRTDGGASSLRKRPIAIESGAARSTAPNDVTIVPMIRSRAPNLLVTGLNSLCQTKPSPKTRIAGHAPSTTRQTMAATTRSASSAARPVKPWSTASPTRSDARRVRGSRAGAETEAASTGAQDSSAAGLVGPRSPLRHTTFTFCVPPGSQAPARLPRMIEMSAPAITVNPPHTEISAEVVFDIDGLNVSYGQAPADKDVSLKIFQNAITALIGPSGCGKSTVLRCLNRMNDLVPSASVDGKVLYHGIDLYGPDVDPIEVRRCVGMVFQRPNPFPKSIYDNVAYGLRILGMKDDLDGRVERALRHAALWDEVKDRLKKSALGLSGGQQQRLCIARAIAVEPDVVLLDEPASALDPISTSAIEDLMHDLKRDYTLVIVTHNMQQAARVADLTAFFSLEVDDGRRTGVLVEYDTTDKIFTNPADKRTEDYVTGRFG